MLRHGINISADYTTAKKRTGASRPAGCHRTRTRDTVQGRRVSRPERERRWTRSPRRGALVMEQRGTKREEARVRRGGSARQGGGEAGGPSQSATRSGVTARQGVVAHWSGLSAAASLVDAGRGASEEGGREDGEARRAVSRAASLSRSWRFSRARSARSRASEAKSQQGFSTASRRGLPSAATAPISDLRRMAFWAASARQRYQRAQSEQTGTECVARRAREVASREQKEQTRSVVPMARVGRRRAGEWSVSSVVGSSRSSARRRDGRLGPTAVVRASSSSASASAAASAAASRTASRGEGRRAAPATAAAPPGRRGSLSVETSFLRVSESPGEAPGPTRSLARWG
mmetsp:Transcript_9964/g.31998  ORF Transcript_9964/g.31998 Transcript_9964/m.31998 type:complete len:347 (+) Transcript_9964:952-1992(+)